MKIIAIALPKGGTGKSTTTIQVAVSLARAGRRVLVIDIDAQGHSTLWLRGGAAPPPTGTYQVLIDGAKLEDVVVPSVVPGIDICGSDGDSLNRAELAIAGEYARETFIRRAIEVAPLQWDYILIDCPPSMGILTANALTAATHVLSPVIPGYFSLAGVKEFENKMQRIKANLNPGLERLGWLLCAVDNREAITGDVRSMLKKFAPDELLPTEVRVDTKLKGAHSTERSRGVQDYEAVVSELVRRLSRTAPTAQAVG